jgi:two-component system, chemotaxis family, protein-glutamate methylesterase/glutaminase
MPPIRILIVDDSVVLRKVLSDALSSDAAFEVVGTTSGGRIALTRVALLRPDLATLDVEMPNLSGLDTILEIRKLYPQLPIIVFRNFTARGAATTRDALASSKARSTSRATLWQARSPSTSEGSP